VAQKALKVFFTGMLRINCRQMLLHGLAGENARGQCLDLMVDGVDCSALDILGKFGIIPLLAEIAFSKASTKLTR